MYWKYPFLRKTWILICVLMLVASVPVLMAQDEESPLNDTFETDELFVTKDLFSNDIGFVAWGDTPKNVTLSLAEVERDGENSAVLVVDYDINAWGGFTHAFTDGKNWIGQDWTAFNALQFWLHGSETGAPVQVEIFDNRSPSSNNDTAERWYFRVTDDFSGWQRFTIPFSEFKRRSDFQPSGAPNDGLNLDEVSGYAFSFPSGLGAQTAYIDEVTLVVEDDLSKLTLSAPEAPAVDLTDRIALDSDEWELVWADEFDAPAFSPIDDESWTCEVGGGGWGNNELQYYTDRPENVKHDGDGNLMISALLEIYNEDKCWYGSCSFTSARCITQDKLEFTYGRVEARIKIPTGQGIWPAFWMLGANFPEVAWPASGEIDIVENIGSIPQTIHGTIHGPGYSGGSGIGNSYSADFNFTDDFHVYGIIWEPDLIRWYVDGELYGVISVEDLEGNTWVYDHDFFLLLNVAVGGEWPGYPDRTTEFPQHMLVDYVRVYR